MPVWLDSRFTPDERAEINHSLKSWDNALNGRLHLHVVAYVENPAEDSAAKDARLWGEGLTITRETEDKLPEYLHEHPELGEYTLGWTFALVGELHLITDRMSRLGVSIASVSAHELGHAFGLDHEDGTLMDASYNRARRCIDGRTLHTLANVQGWDPSSLRPACL
jgi:hypothetical protein